MLQVAPAGMTLPGADLLGMLGSSPLLSSSLPAGVPGLHFALGGLPVAAGGMPPGVERRAAVAGIPPERLRQASAVGAARLRMLQEAAQQHYQARYEQQVTELQQLQEKQQEAAQLALIMQAAEAQAEIAKQTLEDDQEEHDWRKRGRNVQICGNWQRGYCKHGESCQFAHPDKEFGSSSTKRGPADLMRHNFKTAVCRLFSTGNCAHGSRCMFAHGPSELRSPGMPLSKDEDEMVHRVAAGGKRNKEAAERAATQVFTGGGAAAAPSAPNVAHQVATAQMIALAGQAAAAMGQLPGIPGAGAQAKGGSLNGQQQRALDGLKTLGLDGATLSVIGSLAGSGAGAQAAGSAEASGGAKRTRR